MVCKLDGGLYPPPSLMNMYMSFNQMLCRGQDDRICTTNTIEFRFKITEHPLFMKTTRVVNYAMVKNRDAGVEIKGGKLKLSVTKKKG